MFKISLDAGHGINTPGKRVPDNSMHEWEFNAAVVSKMQLELANYENVAVLRLDDPTGKRDVPLKERTDRINGWGSNVHVSVHANASGDGWSSAHGIETFVYKKSLATANALAEKVQSSLVSATGLTNRGVKEGDLHMIRETKAPAILCECGFMSNKDEAALLKSDAYRQTVALAIVSGLSAQFGLKKKYAQPLAQPLTQPKTKTKIIDFYTGWYQGESATKVVDFLVENKWYYKPSRNSDGSLSFLIGGFGEGTEAAIKCENFLKENKYWYEIRQE
jgi:N-acetylmuramoyl-L-alanine amidase